MSDTFTLRVMPKISIDPGIEILDSHSRQPKEHWLPLCSSRLTFRLGIAAAQRIMEDIGDAGKHIEAIKVYFYWNVNKGSSQRICASAIVVEPLTGNKKKIEAHSKITLARTRKEGGELVDEWDIDAIEALSTNFMRVLRWQVMELRLQRDALASTLLEFDNLLSDVPPQPMVEKAWCDDFH